MKVGLKCGRTFSNRVELNELIDSRSLSQIKIESIFNDYRIQSNANNEITMAISSEALLAALRSASTSSTSSTAYQADEIVMKLAKKNDRAVLKFEIMGTTTVGRRVKVTHDVLVDVLKPHEVARLIEPLCPEPDVSSIFG
jgi:HUS1 checkpoint protein